MRYLSTFHPSQRHLEAPCSDGRGCFQTSCRGASGRNRGCVVVVLTYVVCVLGNLPSFYLFRATPLSTAGLFEEVPTTTAAAANASDAPGFVGDRQIMSFAASDDLWIDFTAVQRNLSEYLSSNVTLGDQRPCCDFWSHHGCYIN